MWLGTRRTHELSPRATLLADRHSSSRILASSAPILGVSCQNERERRSDRLDERTNRLSIISRGTVDEDERNQAEQDQVPVQIVATFRGALGHESSLTHRFEPEELQRTA